MLLPQPALPQTSVGRPLGKPPPVISSRPFMPVGDFGNERFLEIDFFGCILLSGADEKSMQSKEEMSSDFLWGIDPIDGHSPNHRCNPLINSSSLSEICCIWSCVGG